MRGLFTAVVSALSVLHLSTSLPLPPKSDYTPLDHRLSFADSPDEITISWNTRSPLQIDVIQYGPTPESLTLTRAVSSSDDNHSHVVRMSLADLDLSNSLHYFYRVPYSDTIFGFELPAETVHSVSESLPVQVESFAMASLDHPNADPIAAMLEHHNSTYNLFWDLTSSSSSSSSNSGSLVHQSVLSAKTHQSQSSWYSHNFGQVHMVAIDNDISQSNMAWLVDDLDSVDREATPWVVVAGARGDLSDVESSLLAEILTLSNVDVLVSLDSPSQTALSSALANSQSRSPSSASMVYMPINHHVEWARTTIHNNTDLTIECISTHEDMSIDKVHVVRSSIGNCEESLPDLYKRATTPQEEADLMAQDLADLVFKDGTSASKVLDSPEPLSTNLLLLLS